MSDVSRDGSLTPTEPRICVIGSSGYFLSGISYFTIRLVESLAGRVPVSAVLMRRLIPKRLYPGRARVGQQLSSLTFPDEVRVFDGVDWYWLPSIFGAARFLARERPTHLVFQWWTGAVLHTFLALALLGRMLGARVIIEFHEVQDPGESHIVAAHWYVTRFAKWLMSMADGFVIHSESDRPALEQRFTIGRRAVAVIPHGPYDHHSVASSPAFRDAPAEVCNLLFFGTIRPYKGLEDLVRAFETVCDADPDRYWLTVIGETWEGWRLPTDLIAASRHADRITLVNRYVTDSEVNSWFAGADAVVLPYQRSSASGPLHLSMSVGLPTVVTSVGGLPEAAAGYDGALFVPPENVAELTAALKEVASMRGGRYDDPRSWEHTATELLHLIAAIG